MKKNYWQEYWDNYYNFMAMYLGEVQNAYPNADIKKEYIEVSRLFEPTMPLGGYNNMNGSNMNNSNNMNNSTNMNNGMNNSNMNNNLEQNSGNPVQNNNEFYGISTGSNGMSNESTSSESTGNQGSIGSSVISVDGTFDDTFMSPGGGPFNMSTCPKMAIVRIEMMQGFNPSNFYMVVETSDRATIQGYRIDIQSNQIRFVPATVQYGSIYNIECAF